MSSYLIKNIAHLVGIRQTTEALRGEALRKLNGIDDAFMVVEGEEIASFGKMSELLRHGIATPANVIDASGRTVMPAWCDSHTHLVYAGSRENEFVDKIRGMTYADIAAKGGGILNSAGRLRNTPEDELLREAQKRLNEALKLGTANIEIKSGYGLTLESEIKMLRVIKRLQQQNRATIRSTFLGAHAIPAEYKNNREGYVRLIIDDMIPAVAAEKLADYIDVFCEQGFFSLEETERICRAGLQFGLRPKIHANQLSASGAVELGTNLGALSVDHLEVMDDNAIATLASSHTIGTMLPTAAFFLNAPYQPARRMIGKNCAVALASDCNPGSSPGLNMNFVVALACIKLKMLPEEAINAATFNGACSLQLQRQTGSICVGKKADLIITHPIPSLAFLPYSFSSVLVDKTMIKGEFI